VFPRVNKMLGRVGKLVESLDAERKTLEEKLQRLQTSEEDKVEQSSKEKHLVTINELIDCVQHLENTPDAAKVDQIAEVLSLMDDDKDGVIQVDHVMKVIELLGTTHAKLPAKQIRQIVDMLAKEEMLEMEDNIEEDMDKALRASEEVSGLKSESSGVPSSSAAETIEEKLEEAVRLEQEAIQAVSSTKQQLHQDPFDRTEPTEVPNHIKEMFEEEPVEEIAQKKQAVENGGGSKNQGQ